MQGKILSVVAGVYSVYLEDKTTLSFTPRGKFRHLKIKPCVGDEVIVDENQITSILPRKNQLIRPSISNLDLGIVVVSMQKPLYSSYLLDKFLSMLKMYNVEPLIILTKIDLEEDKALIERIVKEYESVGIKVIPVSTKNKQGIEEVKEAVKDKTIAFTGQTGVGKSSLINLIAPDFDRAIGEYSKALNRGKHQTKEVIIFPLENGFIADTPGFSSLELDCYKEDLKKYFPFFTLAQEDCFFLDCAHINEPKCVIRQMVNDGIISQEHYDNYKSIYDELIFRKDRFK